MCYRVVLAVPRFSIFDDESLWFYIPTIVSAQIRDRGNGMACENWAAARWGEGIL